MKILILAGGFATRLWPLTENRAKPLLHLDGQSILAHILQKCTSADGDERPLAPDLSDIFLLTNNKFVQNFEDELKLLDLQGINIFVEDAESDGEKLGALGAIAKLIETENISEDIMVLAGDNLLPGLDLNELVGNSDQAILAVRDIGDLYEARKFGVVEVDREPILSVPSLPIVPTRKCIPVTAFAEKPENPQSTLVSTAFMFFGSDLLGTFCDFAKIEPDALGGIFPTLLEKNFEVNALLTDSDWYDVGSFETYLAAHQSIQTETLKIGNNVFQKNNEFGGKVYIGDDCIVENSQLINCLVYPGVKLKNCHVAHTVIDQDCVLENVDLNQKLVRAGTRLKG